MSEIKDKIQEAIKNNEKLDRSAFPVKIKLSDYYNILETAMLESKKQKNEVQESYCAMYLLACIESASALPDTIIQDDLSVEKNIYNEILSTIAKRNRKFKQFVIKNALVSLTLAILAYVVIAEVLMYEKVLGIIVGLIVLALDLYANGKTNDRRFQTKTLNLFNRHVDSNLLLLNEIYFTK